jgi:hypothetical protein
MQIGMIGAGTVGQTLGAALAAGGHQVMIGVREPGPASLEKPRGQAGTLAEWVARTGGRTGSFAEAAAFGEVVFNATQGQASLAALAPAAAHLAGKVLVDTANPLDFSRGFPPFLDAAYAGPTSLGERIQAAHPEARVVKAFNTIAAAVMVNPALIPGAHDLFIAGHPEGKAFVTGLAQGWGWPRIVDLGDISGARGTEGLLPIWLRLWQVTGTLHVNLHVARG